MPGINWGQYLQGLGVGQGERPFDLGQLQAFLQQMRAARMGGSAGPAMTGGPPQGFAPRAAQGLAALQPRMSLTGGGQFEPPMAQGGVQMPTQTGGTVGLTGAVGPGMRGFGMDYRRPF